jgi:hypothetical protein
MESVIDLSIPLHTVIALGFYIIAAIYIIFSIIMYYHWNEYSTDSAVSRITLIVYLVSTVPLISMLGIMSLII